MAAGSDELNNKDAQPEDNPSSQGIGPGENRDSERTLLSSHEWQAINRIAQGDTIHSQRAKALIAIHNGATQAQAGKETGLTRGQVRYWLEKFRDQRLDIFPQDILHEDLGAVQPAGSGSEMVGQLSEKGAETSKKPDKKKTRAKKKSKKSKRSKQKQKPKKKKRKPKERDKMKKKNRKKKKK
jgi:hypothetical protein